MATRKQSNTPKQDEKTGDKKARVQKEYAPVSLDMLKPVKLAAKDKVTVLPGRERSEEQKAVDATVKDLAFEYLAAGSPKQFRDMPVVSYTLPTGQATTVRFMISKACNLLNCKAKFGRQAWDPNGNEVVSFCALPRDPSQWTDKPKSDEPKSDEPKSDEPSAETPAETAGENAKNPPTRTDPSEFANDTV
jgi:hypothetical protein